MQRDLPHADVTEKIIGAAFEVHRVLGYGFLESVYQRAMQAVFPDCKVDARLIYAGAPPAS